MNISRAIAAIFILWSGSAFAQVECNGWGELRGIRIDGELMPISTRLCIVTPGWKQVVATAHWRTRNPTYQRDGQSILCTGQLALGFRNGPVLSFRQTVTNTGPDACIIDIQATAQGNMHLDGVYVFVSVPADQFGNGSGELLDTASPAAARVSFVTPRPVDDKHYLAASASGARFVSEIEQVKIAFDEPRNVTIQDDRDQAPPSLSLFFPISSGDLKSGQTIHANFTIKTTGHVIQQPATVRIDPTQRGSAFAGVGGNFCWGTQAPTVNFYLDNLRVRWARVAMLLPQWMPQEDSDPASVPTEKLSREIRECLRMATELHRRNIPMIISVWNAPQWAYAAPAVGPGNGPPSRARHIDPQKWDDFAKAIGSYLVKFKQVVGVEPELFSFNESNLGINVLLSPQEHRDAIKKLGAYFESLGLRTKLLLGDTNDPKPVEFIDPTLADPDAMKYVGAISYHSWNGASVEQFKGWHERAARANLPLFVTEAGTDPDGYRYTAIFAEPWYAVNEAAMYVQCLSLSQPRAILHWQLTNDYGFVIPGKTADSPQLTQRWWQYKQLDVQTPDGAAVISSTCDNPDLTVAALADADHAVSVIHLVNAGAARPVTISGLPADLKQMRCHLTDATRGMQELPSVAASDGTIQLTIPAQSFLTLAVK